MSELKLYPTKGALLKAVALGVGFVFVGVNLFFNVRGDDPLLGQIIGVIATLAGLVIAGHSAYRIKSPKPSFMANAEGFSVSGGKMLDWDQFGGVGIQTIRMGPFPFLRQLQISTGKGVIKRKRGIRWNHLSGTAKNMAAEIMDFAQTGRHQTRAIAQPLVLPGQAKSIQTETQRKEAPGATRTAAPAKDERALSAAMRGFDDGPIKSGGGLLSGFRKKRTV